MTERSSATQSGSTSNSDGNTPPPEFRQLFDSEFAYVFNTLRRLGVREADLEDVTQEVFITVHRRLGDYQPDRPLKPWLFGIAYRTALGWRRLARHSRELADERVAERSGEAASADELIAERQLRDMVIQGLESIDLDRKSVFVMHDLDGYGMPAIAQSLEIPLNTAYSRLRLAREDFKRALQRLNARRR